MEIESVRARKIFKPADDLTCWEILIKDKQRTTAPKSNIEDPVLRNSKINSAKRAKKWRDANPEKVKASNKKYKSNPANKAKIQEAQKAWFEANPERVKIYRERNKKNVKAWAESHPERIRELGRERDKRRRNSPKRKAWTAEYNRRPEVMERNRERDKARRQTPERKAIEKASKLRQKQRKKAAALFLIFCNIPIIKESNNE